MKCDFCTCDVFTTVRFGGNPLAVIPDARGLTDVQMQQIAREFNYSETTFVLPSETGNTRRVRIFTPTQEVPFAGHPNIGTAFTLARLGAFGDLSAGCDVVFDELAGPVPISIRDHGDGIWCELEAPEPLSIRQTAPLAEIADALSLAPDDIDTRVHEPVVASVGLPFVVVALKDRSILERANASVQTLVAMHQQGKVLDLLAYVDSDDAFDIRSRVFCPLDGVPEDPATGSANSALVALRTHCKADREGSYRWGIAQGVEMGRPSVLSARTEKVNGELTCVWIGGYCQAVSAGVMTV